MYCFSCGQSLEEGVKFCPNCGVKISEPPLHIPKEEVQVRGELTFGTYEGKPINWIILDKKEDRALLLAKEPLFSSTYNSKGDAVTWSTSDTRIWLNEDFLYGSFTSAEQSKILSVKNENFRNLEYDISGGPDTIDSIFLLSVRQAETLFAGDEDRAGYWWYLRTPGLGPYFVSCVEKSGKIRTMGETVNGYMGIRPALWLKLD